MQEPAQNNEIRHVGTLIGASMLLFVLLSQVVRYAGLGILGLIFPPLEGQVSYPEWAYGIYAILLPPLSFVLPYLLIRKNSKNEKLHVHLALGRIPLGILVSLFLGIVILINVLTAMINSIIVGAFGLPLAGGVSLPATFIGRLLYFIAVCVFAPFFEELLFRGAIQGVLRGWGRGFAILISTVLFTLLHTNLMDLLSVFLLSLVLGYTKEITGSVLPCIILHGANNIYTFIGLLIRQEYQSVSGLGVVFWITMAVFAMFFAALWAVRTRKMGNKFFLKKKQHTESFWKRLVLFLKVPLFTVGVVCSIGYFIVRVFFL